LASCWWCNPTPFEGCGESRWHAREAQMRDNPKGGESDSAEGVHKAYYKNVMHYGAYSSISIECDV